MPIEVTCGGCGKVSTVPDSAAGKKGKCLACGSILWIPAAPDEDTDETIPASLKRAAPPPPPDAPKVTPAVQSPGADPAPKPPPPPTRVIVIDAGMPFESMVAFAMKWAFATIPATFALGAFWWLMWLLWGVILDNLQIKR